MKKNSIFFVALVFCAIIGIIAASLLWLKPNLENQIRSYIDALNASGASITVGYDQYGLNVSPVDRTVNFRSVVITSTQDTIPVKISMDNLTIQVATDLLLLDESNLPSTGDVALANHLSIDNLSVTWPDSSLFVEHHEMDDVVCSASILNSIIREQVLPDIYLLLGQLGAGHSASNNLLLSLEQSTRRLATSHLQIGNWRGRYIDQCVLADIDLANQGGISGRLAHLQMQKIHMPDPETLARIPQIASAAENPAMALPFFSDVLAKETVPPVQQIVLDNLTLQIPEGDIALTQLNLLWPSISPQDFSCELRSLALPTSAITSAIAQEGLVAQGSSSIIPFFSGIDTLHANAKFTTKAQDTQNTVLHEQIAIEVPEWGSLDYAHLGDYANPAVGGRFRDLKLAYIDKSLLPRAALLFFPGGKAEQQISTLLDSFSSPGTTSLIGTLKEFIARPGRLEVASLPNKSLSEAEVFLIMANPSAYFTISATPGPKSFTEQCLELKKMQ